MNAVYLLGPRLAEAKLWGKETLKGGQLNNKQLPGFFDPPDTSWSPRVLKDGSDSVGVMGALNRVYINIGLYSEEWTRHFNPFFGGKPIDADPDRDRGKEFRLLARDRSRHAVHGQVSGRGRPAGSAGRRAGRTRNT